MSPDCWHYLLWCQTGLENAIEDLWTRVSDYAENIEFRVTERTVVAGKTLEDILEHMEDQEEKGAIGEIIAEFGSCIQEVISAFNQVMGKLRTKINEYIQSFFLTIFCDLVDYWDNIVGRIREYFRRFFTDIFNDFCELLDALIEKLSDLITKWTWLFSDKVNRFLQYVLRLARCYLRFKDLVDMFANRVARLLCRFLWWVIRRYYGISFIYPQPYEIPFIFEDLPVAPAYP
uniref:Uncharacterized protein n=1 Tax=Branchiostoma floridae TaxID=7739 RepID=C3YTT8_BRAFL|eukprot:XP_002600203.1 hypothetical protein BRAFLDRAFT_66708 [Branchiostoma floridae]